MANLKKLKNQIKAVDKTVQITKAMYSISASKIKKSEDNLETFKIFKEEFEKIFLTIGKHIHDYDKVKEENNISIYILISSDRGLAGNFHTQLFKFFEKKVEDINNSYIYAIGRKAYIFSKDKGYNLLNDHILFNHDDTSTIDFENLAIVFKSIYEEKEIKKVSIIYQKEEKAFSSHPVEEVILPFEIDEKNSMHASEYIFENKYDEIFFKLIYTYLETKIYNALLNSKKCEHSARLIAMKNASDNALKVIEKLSLKYNHERQQSITSELIDVVNGSKVGS